MTYDEIDWVDIDSGNGLLPDGTKPLHEPMGLPISEVQFYPRRVIYQWLPNLLLYIMSLRTIPPTSLRGEWAK